MICAWSRGSGVSLDSFAIGAQKGRRDTRDRADVREGSLVDEALCSLQSIQQQ